MQRFGRRRAGSNLSVRRDLRITATDGSVNISALENTPNQGGYANRYMQGADLNAGRNLQITSAGHILSQGLKASAGGDLRMRAAASLDMAGTSNRVDRFDGFWTINQRLVNTSTLSAGGAMALSAGSDLRLDAVNARAGGAMTLNALGNVRLDASQNWTEMTGTTTRSSKSSTTTHHLREYVTTAPTELSAASVSVKAGNELSTYGSRISSWSGRTELQVAGAANYYAVYDQSTVRDDSHKTRSFLGMRYSNSRSSASTLEATPLVTRMQSAQELTSRSGGDTLMQGTQVNAAWGASIEAGVGERARADARIILEGVRSTVQQSRTAKSDAVVWQSQSGSGSTTQTMALPSFAGGGTFSAPGGISVQIPEGDFKSQITSLSAQPGMGDQHWRESETFDSELVAHSFFELHQTVCSCFRAMKTQGGNQFRCGVRRLCQITERLCNRLTDTGWRGVKQAVNESTGLEYLDAKLAGVRHGQVFGVVGNDHDFVQSRIIFFVKAVDQDQGSGNQVPVVAMYPSGDT